MSTSGGAVAMGRVFGGHTPSLDFFLIFQGFLSKKIPKQGQTPLKFLKISGHMHDFLQNFYFVANKPLLIG